MSTYIITKESRISHPFMEKKISANLKKKSNIKKTTSFSNQYNVYNDTIELKKNSLSSSQSS